jgi:hypothetical protein
MAALTAVSVSRVRNGVDLSALERISRCPLPELHRVAYRGGRGKTLEIRGHRLEKGNFVDTSFRRACPECLEEAGYHRFWWDIALITSCPKHRKYLIAHCGCGSRLSWRSGLLRGCEECARDNLPSARDVEDDDLLAFDAWILSRFNHQPSIDPDCPLKSLPIARAAELLERLGGIDMLGHDAPFEARGGLDTGPASMRARGFLLFQRRQVSATLRRYGIGPARWLHQILSGDDEGSSLETEWDVDLEFSDIDSLREYIWERTGSKKRTRIRVRHFLSFDDAVGNCEHLRPFVAKDQSVTAEPRAENFIDGITHALM